MKLDSTFHVSVSYLPVEWANAIIGVQKVEARACVLAWVTGAGLPLYRLIVCVEERKEISMIKMAVK